MCPLYCNKCYRQRKLEALTLDFYFSKICKHVICDVCLGKNNNNSIANVATAATTRGNKASTSSSIAYVHSTVCPLCQREFHGVAVSKDLPADLVTYFNDPMRLIKRYQDICKFQAKQNELLNIHLTLTCEKKRNDLKRKREAYQKIIIKLEKYASVERERIAKLVAYIDWHKQEQQKRSTHAAGVVTTRPNTPYIIKVDGDNDNISDDDNAAMNNNDDYDEEDLGHPDSGVGSKSTSVLSFMK